MPLSEVVPSALTRRVRQLQRDRGWSQARLAEASGVAAAVLSRVLRGEREWRSEHVAGVAAAFSMTPEQLTEDTDTTVAAGGSAGATFVEALTRAHGLLQAENTRLNAELGARRQQAARLREELSNAMRECEELKLTLERERQARSVAEAGRQAADLGLSEIARELAALKSDLAADRVELETTRLRTAAVDRAHAEAVSVANRNFAAVQRLQQLMDAEGLEAAEGVLRLTKMIANGDGPAAPRLERQRRG